MRLAQQHPDHFRFGARGHAVTDISVAHAWALATARSIAGQQHSPRARIEAAVRTVSSVLATQLDVRTELTESVRDRDFFRTHTARLLRGHVNCEGSNAILLILLRHLRLKARQFETVDLDTGSGDHILVTVQLPEGAVLADAWARAPLFCLARLPGALASIPTVAELRAQGLGEQQGIYAPESYARGLPLSWRWDGVTLPATRDAGTPSPPPRVGDVNAALWRLYLDARVAHLFGDPSGAAKRYDEVAARAPDTITGRVARVLRERVAPPHPPPEPAPGARRDPVLPPSAAGGAEARRSARR